jgi:hypothetical protein
MQQKLTKIQCETLAEIADALLTIFSMCQLSEGLAYWNEVHNKIAAKAHHGTTDGKPYKTPPLTDKDAKNRVFVMAWNHDQHPDYSSGPYKLIDILVNGVYVLRSKDNCSVLMYAYARRATDEEIRQYLQGGNVETN